LNALHAWRGGLLVAGFGKKAAEEWGSAQNGFIFDVTQNRPLASQIEHPHSLAELHGTLAYCESRKMAVKALGDSRTQHLPGYTRGLCSLGQNLFVATSIGRQLSKSTGTINNPSASGVLGGRCTISRLTAETFEIEETVDLSTHGQEIYDLLPVEGARKWTAVPEMTWRDAAIRELMLTLDQRTLWAKRTSEQLAQQDTTRQEIADLRIAVTKQRKQVEGLQELQDTTRQEIADLRIAVTKQREQLEGLQELVESLHQVTWAALQRWAPSLHQQLGYQQLVRRIRAVVRQAVPPDATVILVSKGDDELLKLAGRRAWHFPQTSDGIYAGYNPANSLAAISHLETLRAMGGQFLLFPQTALWWLEHYGEFKRHLDRRYRLIVNEPDRCLIYALHQRPVLQQALWPIEFANLVSDCQTRLDQLPATLDWDTGLELATTFPQYTIFSPPTADDRLPYLDHSIDLVAVSAARPSSLAEARRVAGLAVVTVPAKNAADHDNGLAVEWLSETEGASLSSTSIIIPCYNGIAYTEACLLSLRETLPPNFRGEIIVVDDGSTDDTPVRLQQLAQADKRLILLRNCANAGFLASSNRGARAARGELLIFLNNDTVLLPDWLPPLWQIFRVHPDAGAVGGKLLFADGRLQEAGARVFQDGSAAKIGYTDPDADAPFYNYVRQVDYCSGALLATKRALFEELGGFDPHFQPGYYEDVDYCFRLRQQGYRIYYQPLSAIVHLEGATAGTDLSKGPKQFQAANQGKFVEKWSHVLKRHSPRPDRLDPLTLIALTGSDELEGNSSP
jgi:GT2 family glycosyltransferase